MQRSLISLVFLFLVASCTSAPSSRSPQGNIIPEQAITSKPEQAPVIDDGKLNIALLVPLSKQKEQVGQFLVKSAQLAVIEANNPNLNLIILDSDLVNKDPDLLITKLTEQKVKVILGPVYAPESEKLTSLLKDKQIKSCMCLLIAFLFMYSVNELIKELIL